MNADFAYMMKWMLLPLAVYGIFILAWIMAIAERNRHQRYTNHVDVYPAPKPEVKRLQLPEPMRWIVLPPEDPRQLEAHPETKRLQGD